MDSLIKGLNLVKDAQFSLQPSKRKSKFLLVPR